MHLMSSIVLFFFFNDTATTEIYTLSLHDALPISGAACSLTSANPAEGDCTTIGGVPCGQHRRSEEHTSELQSQSNLVCRLLLEKKKKKKAYTKKRIDQTTNKQLHDRDAVVSTESP